MKKIIGIAIAVMGISMVNAQTIEMIKIPGRDFMMSVTEVTQEQYEEVMGENPSLFQPGSEYYKEIMGEEYTVPKGENAKKLPVECVDKYWAIVFCNKISIKDGLRPVYKINGSTNPRDWEEVPLILWDNAKLDETANGYRLPSIEEWQYAAKGGENYKYSGSYNIDEVAWYEDNSDNKTHEVKKKKANGYGLYDMSGNVMEWCNDIDRFHYCCGGSYEHNASYSEVMKTYSTRANSCRSGYGIRLVRSTREGDRSQTGKNTGITIAKIDKSMVNAQNIVMVKIPGKDIMMSVTEVTQEQYEEVMGENPSVFQPGSEDYKTLKKKEFIVSEGENAKKLPVDGVSWYKALAFCNKKSVKEGLTPVYKLRGYTDPKYWGTVSNYDSYSIVEQDLTANGYRLPTVEEWQYAAKGGDSYVYAGSSDIDEVAWYYENSDGITHEVMRKKPNGYGLYDMSGNVSEWCYDRKWYNSLYECFTFCGGSRGFNASECTVFSSSGAYIAFERGFRVVRSCKE